MLYRGELDAWVQWKKGEFSWYSFLYLLTFELCDCPLPSGNWRMKGKKKGREEKNIYREQYVN